jgi:hypothetical protein
VPALLYSWWVDVCIGRSLFCRGKEAAMPNAKHFLHADFRSQVRVLLRLSSSSSTSDWCAIVHLGCPALSVTGRLRCNHSCHRSNGIRSKVMDFTSGRTFDPNPPCINSFLGRMFLDGTCDRTTTTIVGSFGMLDFWVLWSDVPVGITANHVGY